MTGVIPVRTTLRTRIDDRVNPILVKEVRAALRGRYFQVSFWTMVTIATFVGCAVLVGAGTDETETLGATFFNAIYACMTLGLTLVVPLSAFFSLGTEWEENTYDLLVLSNLRPRQIVVGKLLAVGVQVLLYLAAFLPFLAIAFLLHGLDVVFAGWQIAMTLAHSLLFCAIAVAFSSVSRNRFLRATLIAVLVLLIVYTLGLGMSMLFFVPGGMFRGAELLRPLLVYGTIVLFVAWLATALAETRFMHPEENRSTALRVAATCGVLAGLVWMVVLYWQDRDEDDVFLGIGMPVAAVFALLSILFVGEREALGRRARLDVPANPLLALLVAPFLPGGGRGFLLLLLNLALIGATALVTTALIPPAASNWDGELLHGLLGVSSYLILYLGLPTAFFAHLTKRRVWRVVSRTSVPLLALLLYLIPTLAGFFVGTRSTGRHLGNPTHLPEALRRSSGWSDPTLLLILGVGIGVVALNLPRIRRSLTEVLEASRERRGRASEVPGDARSPA